MINRKLNPMKVNPVIKMTGILTANGIHTITGRLTITGMLTITGLRKNFLLILLMNLLYSEASENLSLPLTLKAVRLQLSSAGRN